MDINIPEICGYLAMVATVVSVIPQAIKCWRTKEVKDVAIMTWGLVMTGSLFWFIYSHSIGSTQMMITNSCVFFGSGSIVLAKLIFREKC